MELLPGWGVAGGMNMSILRDLRPEEKSALGGDAVLVGNEAATRIDGKIERVRHQSRATSSRQPRQVRKEATVTGSCVCSGSLVPGFSISRGVSPPARRRG